MVNLKLLSYNIHKGKSFFFRTDVLNNINTIINDEDYDFIFLQEVKCLNSQNDIASGLLKNKILNGKRYKSFYAKNKINKKSHHGNAILTNHKVVSCHNFDISVSSLEKRGLLVLKIYINDTIVNIACTHLNLRHRDRKKQIVLINKIIEDNYSNEPIIIAGDFNDFNGKIEKLFGTLNFKNIVHNKSFPSIYPFFSIDKVFVKNLDVLTSSSSVKKNKQTALMSDHLPVKIDLTYQLKCKDKI